MFPTAPIGALFDVTNGATPKSDNPDYWGGEIPWVTPADLGKLAGDIINQGEKFITPKGLASCGTQIIPQDSLVLSIRAPIGHLAISGRDLCFNQGCRGLIPRKKIGSRFAYWALINARPALVQAGQGTTFMELGRGKLRAIHIPCPDLLTQKNIAIFLDRETTRIDDLVAKKLRFLEVMKERNAGKFTQEVLQNPSVGGGLTYSGYEWLGEIPSGWDVSRIGWEVERMTYGFTNPMPTEDDGPFMLTANDINFGSILWETARKTSQEAFDNNLTDKSRPVKGDILLTKDGTLGRVAIHDGRRACINQSVALLRPRRNRLNSAFLAAILQTRVYQDRLIFEAGGTTIKHIYISRLARMPLPLPSLEIQQNIASRVYNIDIKMKALVGAVNLSIDRLREYRSALVTAAVTGRINVAEWKLRGTAERRLDAIQEAVDA